MCVEEMLDCGMEQEAADEIMMMEGEQGVRFLKKHMDDFKDKGILFKLIIDVYVRSGYDFPRRIIQKAKALSKVVPENVRLAGLPDGDTITVYRASASESESALKCEPSWTTEKDIAIWFAYHSTYKEENAPLNLYSSKISRSNIIAFTNQRDEYEVIQYRSVKNIKALPKPADEEIQTAMLFKSGITKENEWFDDPEEFEKWNETHEIA